ncbi:flavin reductase family protein [Sinorhizobium numidicum]|uniref:Flavin reductase family protein n=1 Tax=Sinorhizobium numidicum TaxID=680248 RepID=A0ABY8CM95_9HYPH|nr:flavin reductase family protein [Sinorhizobium numidicum]WEX73791.1 flavin reductase family protein [Sinorhizobium numidicum]WEX79776.1 flavin reductase family protein [Sinorhizobium numidicum]
MTAFANSADILKTTKLAPDSQPVGHAGLKIAMRNVAGGVSVVTAGYGADRTGATVTSATALSVDPPAMIVSINRTSSTWPVIQQHGHFCVNYLTAEQRAIAERFAGLGGLKGVERYQGAEWLARHSGASILVGALAAIDCEVEDIIERHSHAIIIGRVADIQTGSGEPLVYHNGQYGRFRS